MEGARLGESLSRFSLDPSYRLSVQNLAPSTASRSPSPIPLRYMGEDLRPHRFFKLPSTPRSSSRPSVVPTWRSIDLAKVSPKPWRLERRAGARRGRA